jgi:hypothetical protein
MFELVVLLILVASFGVGYGSRSYVGAVIPMGLVVLAVVGFMNRGSIEDEVEYLPGIYLVASVVCLGLYLGGVALGRRS